jgi:hypothetical protein
MAAARKFAIETDFINGVFESGIYSLTVSRLGASSMREVGVSIPDITYAFAGGHVIQSDMLEMRGLWVVRGKTVDGVMLDMTVAVISCEYDVELLEVISVKRRK